MKSQLIGKDPDAWQDWGQEKRLKGGEEGGDRGWDGGMASPIQWTWVWANSGRWWRTEKPGMLQSMGLQRDGHNLATEQYTGQFTPCLAEGSFENCFVRPSTERRNRWWMLPPSVIFSVGCLGMNKKSSVHKQCQQPHPGVMNCGFLIKHMKLTQKMF